MKDNTRKLIAWRRGFGRISGCLLVICLLCIADGLTASWRTPFNTLDAIPGDAFALNGPFPSGEKDVSRLVVEGAAPGALGLRLEKAYKGFWFGGLMWKGQVKVAANAVPGDYRLAVKGRGKEPVSPLSRFTIRVYPDASAMRGKAPSYVARFFGLRPFMAAWAFFAAALLTGGGGYLFSIKIATLHRLAGKSEIFMVEKKPEGVFVLFSLGRDQNVFLGEDIEIEDENENTLALAVVTEVKARESKAVVAGEMKSIRPGLIAKLLPTKEEKRISH